MFERFNDSQAALRKEERAELQSLNKRFELYIMNQREKDAGEGTWKREYEQLLAKYKADMAKLQNLHLSESTVYQRANLDLEKSVNDLRTDATQRAADLANALRDLEHERMYSQRLKEMNDKANKEILDLRSNVSGLGDELRSVKAALNVDQGNLSQYKKDLSSKTAETDQLRVALAKAEAQLKSLKDELEVTKITNTKHIKLLEKQLSDLSSRADLNMDKVRREYEDNMNRIFQERHDAVNRDKDKYFEALRHEYEDRVQGFREKLEQMGHDMEVEKQKNRRALEDLEAAIADNDILRDEVDDLKRQKAALVKVVEDMKKGENKIFQEKNEAIRKLKDLYKEKVAEFDSLMDVKIALALELKIYRTLLEAEEERLGIVGVALSDKPISPREAMRNYSEGVSTANNASSSDRRRSVAGKSSATSSLSSASPSSSSSLSSDSGSWFSGLSFFKKSSSSSVPPTITSSSSSMTDDTVTLVSSSTSTSTSTSSSSSIESAQIDDSPKGPAKKKRRATTTTTTDDADTIEATPSRRRTRSMARTDDGENASSSSSSSSSDVAISDAAAEAAAESDRRGSVSSKIRTRPSIGGRGRSRSTSRAPSVSGSSSSSSSGVSGALNAPSGPESSVIVSGADLLGNYVQIRNRSGDAVDLNGWRVEVRDGTTGNVSFTFVFPYGYHLSSGETFSLRTCGSKAEADHNNNRDRHGNQKTIWVDRSVWGANNGAPSGHVDDQCALINPDNELKAVCNVKLQLSLLANAQDANCTAV